MFKFSSKDPYQSVVNFLYAVIDSDELTSWLKNLESESDNMRLIHLAEIKSRMKSNNEPKDIIEIVELLNNPRILNAINTVIQDMRSTGMNFKKNNNY